MSMINQFTAARAQECASSGSVPCVAVLGHEDFDTLCGELDAMFGMHLHLIEKLSLEKLNKCEFQGVLIFRSASTPNGIMIGSPMN